MLVLFTGRMRALALAPLVLGFALWHDSARPAVLVAPSGGLVGILGPQGRALTKPRGDGFAATVWLENDGDAAVQSMAFDRPGIGEQAGARRAEVGPLRLVHVTGRGAAERAKSACGSADVVIASVPVDTPPDGCALHDETRLQETGALAFYVEDGSVRMVTAAQKSGQRPWTAVEQ